MKLYTRLPYGIFLFFFILVYVSCNAEMKFDYERILERNYKTNLELIFDPKIMAFNYNFEIIYQNKRMFSTKSKYLAC